MRIEFLHTPHCPNAAAARELLESVLRERGIPERIEEVVVGTLDEAVQVGFLGSPSIRIDGVDVEPDSIEIRGPSLSCRLYDGIGCPPRALIEAAVRGRDSK